MRNEWGYMSLDEWLQAIGEGILDGKWIVILLFASVAAFILNKLIARIIPGLVKFVADRADSATDTDKLLHWRRLETFIGVILAAVKLLIFFTAIYFAWRTFNPTGTPIALVGASAVFVVLASATVGPLLRDLTYGIIMIAERWYNVGDHIAVEPFLKLGGVVEAVTLRSTKLRSLNGEIIWLHNQHIQGVRVTPRGVRNLAIDVFVSDLDRGKRLMERALKSLPMGATTVVQKFEISETEELAEELWRITAVGQTAPGREWLIEDFALEAITKNDKANKRGEIIVYGPIARFSDDAAERRFKRTVRAKNRPTTSK